MERIKIQTSIFFKNKLILILTLLFFIMSIAYTLLSVFSPYIELNSLPVLSTSLRFTFPTMLFFLFISFEYLIKIKTSHAYEFLKSGKNGLSTYYINGISVLVMILFLYCFMHLAINGAVYFYLSINHVEYLLHIIMNVFLNLFLVPLMSIFLAAVLTFCNKRVSAYVLMIVFSFLTSPVFGIIGTWFDSDANIYIFDLVDFFDFVPPAVSWTPIYAFGFSVLPYRFMQIGVWIFALFAVLIFVLARRGKKSGIISSAICLLVSLGLFLCYIQPVSKIDLSYDPLEGSTADQSYYHKNVVQKEKKAAFVITKYDITFNIGSALSAVATVSLSNERLESYEFTLYHGYIVSKITDVNGNDLRFTQESDYITVYNNSDTPLDKITMYYSGSGQRYFSNVQGISLPGYFPYYPQSGFKEIFDTDIGGFNKYTEKNDFDFNIVVNCPKKVYCNLSDNGHNSFTGKSNAITLVSGFYDSYDWNGVRIIYPYLFETRNFTKDMIISEISGFLQKNPRLGVKKVIVISNVNSNRPYERLAVYHDHMDINWILDLDTMYSDQSVTANKRKLKNYIDTFIHVKELYTQILNQEKANGSTAKESVLLMLDEKMNKLGEEYVIEQSKKFLYDENDTRSALEFLCELE